MGPMDDRERIAEELQDTLPTAREYSSSGDDLIRDEYGWIRDGCRVYGDGVQLFFTDAELEGATDAAGATAWLADLVRGYDGEEGKLERFQAGGGAIMTRRWARILVPCTPPHSRWPSDYIEVEVYLHRLLVGSEEENRHALATVALGTARAAHEQAGCPVPSQLPAQATRPG